MSGVGDNRLKKLSADELQDIIAKAISTAIDDEVLVSISTMNYSDSDIQTKGTFTIHVSPSVEFG